MCFQNKIKDLITLLDKWLSDPNDFVQLEQWIESAHTITWSYDFSEKEQHYVDNIIDMYYDLYKKAIESKHNKLDLPLKEYLDELLSRKQVEQRTPEWYKQMTTIISASELGSLFASPYIRSKLVIAKTTPYQARFQPLAVLSDRMSAFDWGIRFEPVVKQIYEYKYGVNIKELGRLQHQTDPRCSASPDGLIYSCPKNERTGRLVEIKCPVTRAINGSIPKEYYDQMQMQLQVTGLMHCDYVEAVFSSKYNNMPQKDGQELYKGYIALVRYAEMKEHEFYYIYSPVNCDEDWMPIINMEEEIVEIIPWKLIQWGEQLVCKNEEWWTAICPVIDKFWEDVEKEKCGEFIVPESSRPSKKQKVEKCMIVFKKDENGMDI